MKKTIITTSVLALFAGAVFSVEYDTTLESRSDLNIVSHSTGAGIVAGNFSNKSVLMDNISYENISVSLDSEDNSLTYPYMLHGGIARITGGSLTVNKATFKNISMHSQYQVQGGAIYLNGVGTSAVISDSTFDSIVSSNGDYTGQYLYGSYAMGSAIINYRADLAVNDTVFSNNKSIAGSADKVAEAGAVYLMMTGKPESNHTEGEKVSFTNTKFLNNSSVNSYKTENSTGGAITVQGRYDGVFDSTRSLTFTDSEFIGNSAAYGGAIFSDSQSMTFNVSSGKSLSYTGNKSLTGDAGGGFLLLSTENSGKNTSATFNIESNAKLTIGESNSESGYDSIASLGESATASIIKTGEGSLIVNGSMEYFTGVLDVQEGSMTVNSVLGASDIIVAGGAVLALGENADIILHGCSITVEEGGSLELGANTSITVNLEQDFAGSTNLFTIADGANLTQNGETVTLAELEENMTVTYNGEVLDNSQWSFDSITGKLTASVPEPSTYAAIFGALALAFAAYRRRK